MNNRTLPFKRKKKIFQSKWNIISQLQSALIALLKTCKKWTVASYLNNRLWKRNVSMNKTIYIIICIVLYPNLMPIFTIFYLKGRLNLVCSFFMTLNVDNKIVWSFQFTTVIDSNNEENYYTLTFLGGDNCTGSCQLASWIRGIVTFKSLMVILMSTQAFEVSDMYWLEHGGCCML